MASVSMELKGHDDLIHLVAGELIGPDEGDTIPCFWHTRPLYGERRLATVIKYSDTKLRWVAVGPRRHLRSACPYRAWPCYLTREPAPGDLIEIFEIHPFRVIGTVVRLEVGALIRPGTPARGFYRSLPEPEAAWRFDESRKPLWRTLVSSQWGQWIGASSRQDLRRSGAWCWIDGVRGEEKETAR